MSVQRWNHCRSEYCFAASNACGAMENRYYGDNACEFGAPLPEIRFRTNPSMKLKQLPLFLAVVAALFVSLPAPRALAADSAWSPIGPDGGDARRFAFDPRDPSRVYLGTTDSWIYVSTDGGSSWVRLAKLVAQDNLVVDSLVVDRSDPNTLFAGVHVVDRPDGGVYISHDRGVTWSQSDGIKGQAVLALAQATSRSRVLIAGTLKGVFRTDDRGLHWRQISDPAIHEVQSISIDPYDPDVVYAGTWHLPWRTRDGGAHWSSIKDGLIDDSDVFSVVVDPSRPSVLFLSACSGIYRTDNYGDLFRKVQGIPSTARRTRVLAMDPVDRSTVYAGTTEGLYKTTDGGDNWTRTTGTEVIVIDVYVDPRNTKHVLLATDRSGVLASDDGGANFQASNAGFSQRQVAALLPDAKNPGTLYAGVINDKTFGGVFVTADYGKTWKQQSDGLNGVDVFELAQSGSGTLLTGTSNGMFRWSGSAWVAADGGPAPPPAQSATPKPKKSTAHRTSRPAHRPATAKRAAKTPDLRVIRGRVTALAAVGSTWYAATAQGVFRSTSDGDSWDGPILGGPVAGSLDSPDRYTALSVFGSEVYAARRDGVMFSTDGGTQWLPIIYPSGLTAIDCIAAAPDGALWAGGREGVFYTADRGRTWQRLRQLPVAGINSLAWDAESRRMLLTSGDSTVIFAIDPADKTWKWWNAGWPVHSVATLNGRLLAASLFSGVVAAPEPETASAGGSVTSAQR
jgi:photosystem II stability/assembly factor-like uncharacterized protein